VFLLGALAGGYAMRDTQPRAPLRVGDCGIERECIQPRELAGLIASIGIQRTPELVPSVVLQNRECVAIRHPFSSEAFHYVLFTRRDIRNVGEVSEQDASAVLGCVAIIGELARSLGLTRYRVYTNGPGKQEISHLHFHVVP
jgi:diadenosine tetraphosphate (Ap4A) HIT family hydrolase